MSQATVFELPIRVAPADLDELERVNNVVYLRYAQEAAIAHWTAAATPEQIARLVWVVRRHEVDYLKPALLDDQLIVRTWVGPASGATFDRHVEVTRGEERTVLARVRSVWVALDATTQRPRRITADLLARFHEPVPDEPG